jgi:hypothetical protein
MDIDELRRRAALLMYRSSVVSPDDGTSMHLIVRIRYSDGRIQEKCVRCWQPGEIPYFGVGAPKRRKPPVEDE